MPTDFPPRKDSELFTMAANASTKISAHPTDYGLSVGQAASLATVSAAYSAAYNLAIDPPTRTKLTIIAKGDARRALVQNLRDLNRFVQATKTVGDLKKAEIGFPVYANRTPIPAPDTEPVIMKVITTGRRTKVTLRGMDSERRGRPTGVQGALIISYQGATPPADTSQWKIEGLSTKTGFEIIWSPTIPVGAPLWVSAAWYSPRGQAGPACTPVSVAIGGGMSAPADAAKAATEAA
jgi:hypothetical protein